MLKSAHASRQQLVMAASGRVLSNSFNAVDKCREISLKTVRRKFGDIPDEANDFKPFELHTGNVQADRFIKDNTDIWALRYSEPDSSVAGREWRVELTSANIGGQGFFSCRLSCFSRDHNFEFGPSTPGPLKEIVSAISFFNGNCVFHHEAQIIESDSDLDKLIHELNADKRWWNTIVVAQHPTDGYPITPSLCQSNLMGIANVYMLPTDFIPKFTTVVGPDFNVYHGGARSFRPKFDHLEDDPLSHPVIRATDSQFSTNRAIGIICHDAFRASIQRTNFRSEAPSYFEVKNVAARERYASIQNTGESEDVLVALREELDAAREEANEALELGMQADEARTQTQKELENERSQAFVLKGRIEILETKLNEQGRSTELANPKDYTEMPDWAAKSFAGRLRIHNRAARSLKKANYEKIDDVINGLRLLANDYRDLKTNKIDLMEFDDKMNGYGLSLTRSISENRAGEQGAEYFIKHKGREIFLDQHITKGTSKDTRYCLRIYFHYDEEDNEIIVGWLPSHLDIRST